MTTQPNSPKSPRQGLTVAGLTIAAALLAVLAFTALSGTGLAVTTNSEVVNVTNADAQKISVDVELLKDPQTNNATVHIIDNATAETVHETQLNGTVGGWEFNEYAVNETGEYEVRVTADNSTAIGNVDVQLTDETEAAAGASSSSTDGPILYIAAGILVFCAWGAYYVREKDDGYN